MKNNTLRPLSRFISSSLPFVLALTATPALAFQFKSETGEVTGSFDTTLSYGAAWRMQGRDPALVGIANGGTARSVNEDDGNLNYKKGGAISSVLKSTHDLDVKYRQYGFFLRGSYFYDHVASNKDELGPLARDRAGSEAQLLDAFVRGEFDVSGRALNLRLGKQVVNWGESTFIGNGINVINPVDVTKLRVPGAELREGLIPTTMLWASQEITNKTTLEVVLLNNFDKTRIDPRGTFFSTNDFISDDGDRVYAGFGRRVDQHLPPGIFGANANAAAWAPRAPDRSPSDSGQYGLAFRAFAPELGNTEFGLYHLNYHSRTPLVSGVRGGVTVAASPVPGCTVINLPLGIPGGCGAPAATYFAEYPEDIRLYGLSFNSQIVGGIALQGEYSYRPNQPLQVATPELLLAALGLTNQITGGGVAAASVPLGTEISGYRRVSMHQLQFSATKAFGPSFGAQDFILVGEMGYNRFELPDGLGFNGPAVFLPAPGSSVTTSSGSSQPGGYFTSQSWGYRLVGRLEFPSAIGAATLSPRLVFTHDVDGVGLNFNEGVKAVTLGLGINYRQNWQADIAYTNFFGGRTYAGTDPGAVPAGQSAGYASSANPLKDRDFLAVSVSYSF